MKLAAFNVNGIRAVLKKGSFEQDMAGLNPDVLLLEETKLSANTLPYAPEGYEVFSTISKVKKGYSGVAILSKIHPESVSYGLIDGKYDEEGRAITLEFPDFYFVGLYVPNSGQGLARLGFRLQFQKDLEDYLNLLQQKKPVVVTGDMNVAPEEIDIKNPKSNRMSAGFTDQEREAHRHLLKATGTVDCFRRLYPDRVAYTWWSYMFHAREHDAGWRIDHFLVSESLFPHVKDCVIHKEIMGSDHCPIELDLD